MHHHAVFTYGTLQLPAIMTAVTGRVFRYEEALLSGHKRYRIRNQVFPGIIPQADCSVPGIVYWNVDPSALLLLDDFEDELYVRRTLPVDVSGREVAAEVYIVADRYRCMLEEPSWSLQHFRRRHMQYYLRSCRRFFRTHTSTPVAGQ